MRPGRATDRRLGAPGAACAAGARGRAASKRGRYDMLTTPDPPSRAKPVGTAGTRTRGSPGAPSGAGWRAVPPEGYPQSGSAARPEGARRRSPPHLPESSERVFSCAFWYSSSVSTPSDRSRLRVSRRARRRW